MLLGFYAENQHSDTAIFKPVDELSFDAALPVFYQSFLELKKKKKKVFFIGSTSSLENHVMDLDDPNKGQKTTATLGRPYAGDSGQQVTADTLAYNSTTPCCDPTARTSKVLLIITHNVTCLYFNCKITSVCRSLQLCCLIYNFNEMPSFRNLRIFLTSFLQPQYLLHCQFLLPAQLHVNYIYTAEAKFATVN